jgi:hypothetical protein
MPMTGVLSPTFSARHPEIAHTFDNLDPNRPIAIEDAYVIPHGEIGVEGGVTFNDRKQGRSRFGFQPQIIYGALPNLQVELMTNLLTESMTVAGDDKSGDLSVGVLYNFNTETVRWPAFAVRPELGFPTGVNSKGLDTEVTGVMTRAFGRWRTHLNVGYTFLGSPQNSERRVSIGWLRQSAIPSAIRAAFRTPSSPTSLPVSPM